MKNLTKAEKEIVEVIREKKIATMKDVYRATRYAYPKLDMIFIGLIKKKVITPVIQCRRRYWVVD